MWHKALWFWLGVVRREQKVAFPPALCQNLAQKVRSVSDLSLPDQLSADGTDQLLLSWKEHGAGSPIWLVGFGLVLVTGALLLGFIC